MKKRTAGGITKGVLLYSAPFVLISASIIFLVLWASGAIIENNMYYRLATMAPSTTDVDSTQLVLTEEDKKNLEENNKGDAFVVSSDFPAIALGEQWATITIESANVDHVPVLHGDYEENLLKGIGHYANSRFPGQGGKVVLPGHVGIPTHFQRLETMQVGDLVELDTIYGEYVYKVVDTVIFDQNDPSLLLPEEEEKEMLICYTCYPYYTTSVRTQRFAIICELVSGKNWRVSADSTGTEG